MCQHHHPLSQTPERAESLDHGHAHDQDHESWTRRDFLVRAGLGSAAVTLASSLGSTRAYALDGGSLLGRLAALETDRVLVLLQMSGGNDGLNTIVPIRNDLYYTARPTIALAAASTVPLSDAVGMHASMAPLESMWGAGQMAVVHAAGYSNPSLSHFAATDIWTTAQAPLVPGSGGWAGRTLRTEFPTYGETLPAHPPAVQIGANNPLLFQSGDSDLSMRIGDAAAFQQIVAGEGLFDPDDVPATAAGAELGFVRSVANASNRYIGAVQQAGLAGTNTVGYPTSGLGKNLAAVARLVKGGLSSRIYLVSLGGFDTHTSQLTRQAALLSDLAASVSAFHADLDMSGHGDRVLTMTFSEFGRRVKENGSNGTDHGTSAPLFAFGKGVSGGFFGAAPDLANLDSSGNLRHTTDFRSAYAAVLGSWLGLPASDLPAVLGGSYEPVAFVGQPVASGPAPSASFTLDAPFPNPTRGRSRIPFTLDRAGTARVDVFDTQGRHVATLADGETAAGSHAVEIDGGRLAAGVYVVRLTTDRGSRSVRLNVVR